METCAHLSEQVHALRAQLGQNLVIMGHHYQSDAVMAHVDTPGDSLELARMMEKVNAEHIVFCGVHFMAESAALLAKPGQKVYLPEPNAHCVMASMSPAGLLNAVLERIWATGRKIIPLAYVNTTLAVKAVVGKYQGAVCTSANAPKMLEWAMAEGDGVLFLPDQNLGNNTANTLKIDRRHTLNVQKNGQALDMQAIAGADIVFWPGCCAVHARISPQHVDAVRSQFPGIRVLVHPECHPLVVAACDGAGSTSYLIQQAAQLAESHGEYLAIGTEINLVQRLAQRHAGTLNIVPLLPIACSHMAKVTEAKLGQCLTDILGHKAQAVCIDQGLAEHAQAALERMFRA